MSQPSVPELRVARSRRVIVPGDGPSRHFVGLVLDPIHAAIDGCVVRVHGRGYEAVGDVMASYHTQDARIPQWLDAITMDTSVEVAEAAHVATQSLLASLDDHTTVRTIALVDFGTWRRDALGQVRCLPVCDTAQLSAATGLTVIDDVSGGDVACGGRGVPIEASGAWLMAADRGFVPGRVIRALLDLSDSARLVLLPPRQPDQLPIHLRAQEIAPALSLLSGLTRLLTGGTTDYDVRERWSVQGRQMPDLFAAWQDSWAGAQETSHTHWYATPLDPEPLIRMVADWPHDLTSRVADVLCTAVHWISRRVADFIRDELPRSQPVGQIVVTGAASRHAFLRRELHVRLPEVEAIHLDDLGFAGVTWRSAAAALLGTLVVDQRPANSPRLTGARQARVIGRITPGSPSNWHRILAEMSETLPDKKTLRSAV